MDRIEIMGVTFHNVTLKEAADLLTGYIKQGLKCAVATPNPEIVQMAAEDREFGEILSMFDLVVPDGVGVLYASRILGRPLKEKVPGIDLADEMLKIAAKNGYRVFLLGTKEEIVKRAAGKICEKYPGIKISGVMDGYFKEDQTAVDAINSAGGAEIVLVCLGAPKQEKFIHEHKGKINGLVMIGLGGSLDVFAGAAKRAPRSMQRLGLEWLYRLARDPKRIGRMAKLPIFLVNAFRQKSKEKDKSGEE